MKLALLALVAITAFSSVQAAPLSVSAPVASTGAWTISLPPHLQAVIVADLQAAAADAAGQTPPDVRHGPCWTALASFAQNGFANPLPDKPGIFLLIQKGFDFQGAAGTPLIPTALAQACGPTVLDLKVSFAQFLAKAGFAVSPIKLPVF